MHTQIVRPDIPANARTPCDAPRTLPDRDLKARETASLWGMDRTALRACEIKRRAAIDAAGSAP